MHVRIREACESYGTNGENLGRGGVAADAEDLQLQWERSCINGTSLVDRSAKPHTSDGRQTTAVKRHYSIFNRIQSAASPY